eukprot:scaffold7423_cov118-Isochrysis_galbana.AAC.1
MAGSVSYYPICLPSDPVGLAFNSRSPADHNVCASLAVRVLARCIRVASGTANPTAPGQLQPVSRLRVNVRKWAFSAPPWPEPLAVAMGATRLLVSAVDAVQMSAVVCDTMRMIDGLMACVVSISCSVKLCLASRCRDCAECCRSVEPA